MDSSVKVSSSEERAPRSGTAKATIIPSFTICRTRPRSLESAPAMEGWRTSSVAVEAAPARMMDESVSRCCVPKSMSRGAQKRPSVGTRADEATAEISSNERAQSSKSERGSASTMSVSLPTCAMGDVVVA